MVGLTDDVWKEIIRKDDIKKSEEEHKITLAEFRKSASELSQSKANG